MKDLPVTCVMPGMNGRDMARKMFSLCPNLKCLYMSRYAKVREALDSQTG